MANRELRQLVPIAHPEGHVIEGLDPHRVHDTRSTRTRRTASRGLELRGGDVTEDDDSVAPEPLCFVEGLVGEVD
jgi:hypothetical protein